MDDPLNRIWNVINERVVVEDIKSTQKLLKAVGGASVQNSPGGYPYLCVLQSQWVLMDITYKGSLYKA